MYNKFQIVIVAILALFAIGFTTNSVSAQVPSTVEVRVTTQLEEIPAVWPTHELTELQRDISSPDGIWVLVIHPRWGTRFVLESHWNTLTGAPVVYATSTPMPLATNVPGAISATATPGSGGMTCVANSNLFDVVLSPGNGRASEANTLVQWAPNNTNRATLVIIPQAGVSLNAYNGAAWSYHTDNLVGCIATQLGSFPDATSVVLQDGTVFLTRAGNNVYDASGTLIYTIP